MKLEKLRGRRSKLLKDLENEPLVLELSNGKVVGGRLDRYYYNGGGIISLYSCKSLNRRKSRWNDSSPEIIDGDAEFWLSEIREIFLLPEAYRERILELDDVLQIHIDPYYKPIMGIRCDWNPGRNWKNHRHQADCDFRLHEALTFIRTHHTLTKAPSKETEWGRRRFQDGFGYVRRRLLMYGAKIP